MLTGHDRRSPLELGRAAVAVEGATFIRILRIVLVEGGLVALVRGQERPLEVSREFFAEDLIAARVLGLLLLHFGGELRLVELGQGKVDPVVVFKERLVILFGA